MGTTKDKKRIFEMDQKKHFDDIMSYLNNSSNDSSKFVKFVPNQTKIFKVLTDKTELVDVTFPSDPNHVVKGAGSPSTIW